VVNCSAYSVICNNYFVCVVLFVFSRLSSDRSSVLVKKRAHVRANTDQELHLHPVVYQRNEPNTVDGQRSQITSHKTGHAASQYPAALHYIYPLDAKDNAGVGLGLGLSYQLEDGAQPGRNVGESETGVKFARSRSLPNNQLFVESETDGSDNSPENIQERPSISHADILPTYRQYREEAKPAEYQRSCYLSLSNVGLDQADDDAYIDENSLLLIRAPEWTTADRPTTSAQIETVL